MYLQDDSDMKIAENVRYNADESDSEARLYAHERDNGNLEKAHAIGKALADALLCEDGFAFEKNIASDFDARNRCVLFAFTADRVLDTFMPNQIIARSAQNEFFDEIRLKNIGLYESISRSGAFSMYLLCRRSGDGRYIGTGKVYANIVRRPDDEPTVILGDQLYLRYFEYCVDKIRNIEFSF